MSEPRCGGPPIVVLNEMYNFWLFGSIRVRESREAYWY
jgi:hypothetical protein